MTRVYSIGSAAVLLLVACGLALGAGTLASTSNPSSVADGDLHELMEEIGGTIRSLARSVGAAEKQADALEHVATMQELALEAKALIPPKVSEIPSEEQDAFKLDYRKAMANLLKELSNVEIAIIEGRHDEAKKMVFEDLVNLRDEAHEKFQ